MYKIKVSFILLIGLICLSCSDKNEVIHPRESFIERVESLEKAISIEDYEKASRNLFKNRNSDITYIGGGEIGADNFIVNMKNVIIDDYGRVYVSIPSENKIKIFDRNGYFLRDLGRNGRGPGEFEFLSTIKYHSGKDLLIALDNKDIEIYSVGEAEIKHKEKVYNHATQSTDLCVTQKNIIVNGFIVKENDSSSSKSGLPNLIISPPMHAYSLDSMDEPISFGESYKSEHGWGIFDGMLSTVSILCDESSDIVIGLTELYPYLNGYNSTTYEKVWEAGISDVNIIKYLEENKRGANDISLAPKNNVNLTRGHKNISFIPLDIDNALIQFNQLSFSLTEFLGIREEISKEDYSKFVKIISIVIDRNTGKMEFTKTNYPTNFNGVQEIRKNKVIIGPVVEDEEKGIILAVIQD